MGGRVVAGARLVAGAGNDTAIHHQHCANRDLAALAGCHRFFQRGLHEFGAVQLA